MNAKTFKVKVWGENACFTRPEMKVERVSYDVMTPSAARGILEAILWKPAIRWVVTRIDVLNPICWQSVRRNELAGIAASPSKELIVNGKGSFPSYYIDEPKDNRQQRAGLFLKDVAYVIHAHFLMTSKAEASDNPIKFTEQFMRRLEKGQCHNQPYLGCREFSAYFAPAGEADVPQKERLGEYYDKKDLGWMLHDIDFDNNMQSRFFRAEIINGSIDTTTEQRG